MSEAGGAADRDEEWAALARVGAGDGEAFTALVERHQVRLARVCERLLGDRDEALDACQEVFLRVYRHAATARPRGQLFTWIYRIAVNHCLNRLRRRKVLRVLSFGAAGGGEDDAAPFDPPSAAPGAQVELETRERWRRTRRALARLPPGQRAVVVLAKFEGLSQKQIAAALGISEGAVESRLVRALRRLSAAQDEPAPRVQPGRAVR